MSTDGRADTTAERTTSNPDVSFVVAVREDEFASLDPATDVIAAHLARRSLTWELVIVAAGETPLIPEEALEHVEVIRASGTSDPLGLLRIALQRSEGDVAVLVGPDVSVGLAELDRMLERLGEDADIVLAWPAPRDGRHDRDASGTVRGLPDLMACGSSVGRSIAGTRAVFGGSSFGELMQVAEYWGLRIAELAPDDGAAPVTVPYIVGGQSHETRPQHPTPRIAEVAAAMATASRSTMHPHADR